MILKELEPFAGQDKFQVAGRRAEEQMAHYLRRFFGSSNDVDVLNYLRIDLAGEVAQMDHLVLHPYGLLIVESKSVAGSVQIKEDGQWIRWFNKQPQGMRSPVTQAKMQAMLLKELFEKTVKQKGFFEQVQVDVLVAISDSGTIQWPATGSLPEVCKADQVPERITQRVSERRSATQLAGVLTTEHRRVIAEFLCKVHKPLAQGLGAQPKLPESVRADQEVAAAEPPTLAARCTSRAPVDLAPSSKYQSLRGHIKRSRRLNARAPRSRRRARALLVCRTGLANTVEVVNWRPGTDNTVITFIAANARRTRG